MRSACDSNPPGGQGKPLSFQHAPESELNPRTIRVFELTDVACTSHWRGATRTSLYHKSERGVGAPMLKKPTEHKKQNHIRLDSNVATEAVVSK